MGMCKPSGGIEKVTGRLGDLPTKGAPNSRKDLYNKNGEKIQSRWYDSDGNVTHNRDYIHGGKDKGIPFPHDHEWYRNENGKPERGDDHLPVNPDFI
jgi:hypothetical protein